MTLTEPRIPIGLVEDDVPYRTYLSMLLESSDRFSVAFETATISEGAAYVRRAAPRLLLLDLRLPGVSGAEGIERFAALAPQMQVLVLTSVDRDDALLECIRAGASGYLLKGIGSDDLLKSLDEALAGGAPMSPSIARRVLGLLRTPAPASARATPPAPGVPSSELSPRELEVLQLVAAGLSDKEVAHRLGTAVSTVKNQLSSIYVKWRVRSRTEAVVRLLQRETK
jgi:DNA-binding NarL/FixJ family response regulator